jgi:hypothetical protein
MPRRTYPLLNLFAFLVPALGILFGLYLYVSDDEDKRDEGVLSLWIAVASFAFWVVVGYVFWDHYRATGNFVVPLPP